jgi:glycosyltransferase involved in cell wall biosynthesis
MYLSHKASHLNVLNVNSVLSLKSGGGTAERTFQMSRYLALQGVNVIVLTLDLELDESRIKAILPATVKKIPCLLRRFYLPVISLQLISQLVKKTDIIHLMGHWSVLNALVYFFAQKYKKPYVVCPAGALPIFGRSAFIKGFYNLLVGRLIIRDAAGWIAVTESEIPSFEAYGISPKKITVIPNGIIDDDFSFEKRESFLLRNKLPDAPFVLFVGRLSYIKGPDILLRAFILEYSNFSKLHLFFAGPDDGMLKYLQELVKNAGLTERVHFLGYIDGQDKSSAYRNAKILVVPSRKEAMSIVALEAGINGALVMLTDQCGFSQVRKIDPRLEVQATVEGIALGLRQILNDEVDTERLKLLWKNLVVQNYDWKEIIKKYKLLYQKILNY